MATKNTVTTQTKRCPHCGMPLDEKKENTLRKIRYCLWCEKPYITDNKGDSCETQ